MFLLFVSFNAIASEVADCTRENPESLWVEDYTCKEDRKVQIGHELINNSIIVKENNIVQQHYQEKDNKLNMDYLKAVHNFKKDN
jgi:hypothetical protein